MRRFDTKKLKRRSILVISLIILALLALGSTSDFSLGSISNAITLVDNFVREVYATPEPMEAGEEGMALGTYIVPNVKALKFDGNAYVTLNNNTPYFSASDLTTTSYEYYSPFDSLGRCGITVACLGTDLMPEDAREDISSVRPTGWMNRKYENIDNGGWIYNRCHLIGFQLAGENANELNLITGTRYLNVTGMLPFENEVAEYLHKNPKKHVLYRVVPVFDGDNLLASGVTIEAFSVEDNGKGVCFNVYCFNVQPGFGLDYETGESWAE